MQSIENQVRERVARFLEVTSVSIPLMNAPMAEVSGPALTAAVCRAGGLGVLAGDELLPEALSNAIDEVRRLAGADARFAVNLRVPPAKAPTPEGIDCQRRMLAALEDLAADLGLEPNTIEELPDFDAQFDVLLEKHVPVVSVTFGGLREEYDERLKEAGTVWMGTATTLREAKVLRAAGADLVVVQGIEAGGPRLNFESSDDEAAVGMSVLTTHAARATRLPVIASGGIAEPQQVYGALAAGARAVMVGSALLRTVESTIVLSTQHSPEWSDGMSMKPEFIEAVIENIIRPVMPAEWLKGTKFLVNPTGRFVVGGPQGDCGLTGRKIIVDTYGGSCPHGGGAFSGKDPTKVDRSAAYACRYVAKNIVAAGLASRCQVQVAYAIGVAEPMNITVRTMGTGKVSDDALSTAVRKVFDLRPGGILQMLDLRRPIYSKTAAYGHFGREEPEFTWEKTDKADILKEMFC